MTTDSTAGRSILVLPATAERWPDLERLFGENDPDGGCWCMFWRLNRSEFNALNGEGARSILRSMVQNGEEPGVIAYADGIAAGWCSLGPRENFRALENSRTLRRIDAQPVWSIVCIFVLPAHEEQLITRALLAGAVGYAQVKGARIVEGYPLETDIPQPQGESQTGYRGYMGSAAIFRSIGFTEVARASESQMIMRYYMPSK